MWVITREPFWFLAIVLSSFTSVLCDVSHLRYPNQDHFVPEQHNSYVGLSPVASSPQRNYHGQDGKYDSTNDGSGWDIRLSVPGEPERDYPLLNSIPQTSFNCYGKTDGYYADIEARCQVFRVCAITAVEGYFSFLCPNGTLFNQKVLVCDWWMNVECPIFDSEIETKEKLVMKTGPALMEDIRQMIMYPTTVPAPNTNPPMETSMQVYNPPADMFPPTPNSYKPDGDTSGALNLPVNSFGTPSSSDNNIYNKGSYSIGSAGFGQNPTIPDNQVSIPVFANLGTQSTADLNIQKAFNAQQAFKVTKQQFTYPSAYDKQYTVSRIATVDRRPLVIRVPINVAAFQGTENTVSGNDTSQESSYSVINRQSLINKSFDEGNSQQPFIPSPLPLNTVPFIVFLVRPPANRTPQLITNSFQNVYNISSNNTNIHLDSLNESSSNYEQTQTPLTALAPQHEASINQRVQESMTAYKINSLNRTRGLKKNSGSHFTANVASQTNYYITNNVSKKEKDNKEPEFEFESEAENITVSEKENKPARLTTDSEFTDANRVDQSNRDFEFMRDDNEGLNQYSFITNSSNFNETNITVINTNPNNLTKSYDDDLVTLFSAHVIPGGDVNKEKILKLCIPKHVLTYLLSFHNATKNSLLNHYSAYTNADSINKLVTLASNEPIFKRIMQNFIMRNNFSNLQVPFTAGVSAFGQTNSGFKNNYQETSGKLAQSEFKDQSVSGISSQTFKNEQKTTNGAAYQSQFSNSSPYTQNTQEEKKLQVNSGFYQTNQGKLQNDALKTSVQSKFAQQNGYNQGTSVTGTNQYSSKFSKDSTAAVSGGAKDFNQNAQGLSQFGNFKEQVAGQFGNYKAQDVSQNEEYKKQEVSQFDNNQNENSFQRSGQLKTYGTNESGPDNGREYYSQFDTNSGTRPIITEIENQGEFFSIQDDPRRPANKRPQIPTGTKPTVGANDEQSYNTNAETQEGQVQQNGITSGQSNKYGFATGTKTEIGTAFGNNGQNYNFNGENQEGKVKQDGIILDQSNKSGFSTETKTAFGKNSQVQNYNLGIQNQRQNEQSKFGQFTATVNQAKNNAAYNVQAGIKTNSQNNQFGNQKYNAGNSQAEGSLVSQNGSIMQGENYNDGGLISVQQQLPFNRPNNQSPFVKSSQTNGNTANQQTSRYTAFGSTQTTAPVISSQQYNTVKTQEQYVNTNTGTQIKSNSNDIRQGSVQSGFTKQTVNNSPTQSEYNRELSFTQTSGGQSGQSDKFTQGSLLTQQGQTNGNRQFATGDVKTVINKFDSTSHTSPISGEYNREFTYTSNIQTAPVVTSGKFTQEASYSKQNQFNNNYQSDRSTITSSNNKFVSNQNVNSGVKTSQYNQKQNAPVTSEHNQQFSYTYQSATPTVNTGQSTQQSYLKQGQLSNNYQTITGSQHSGISNFKTNSQYTQNNKNYNSQETYNSQQSPIITTQNQFLAQQKQTNTHSSQPNHSSGSFFGSFAAQNGNRNQESKYFTNSQTYNGVYNKNGQLNHQSNHNGGLSANQQLQQSQSGQLNNNENSGRLTSQVSFGGHPTPATEENFNYNIRNRYSGVSGQTNNGHSHTNIEVVPAYGFLLNSDREKQEYFNALSQGLSYIQKIYEAPYRQTAEYTGSYKSSGPVVSDYRFNQQRQVSNNYQSPHYISPTSGGLISGQGASGNLQSTSNTQSLPIENLGYPQVKPSISFSY